MVADSARKPRAPPSPSPGLNPTAGSHSRMPGPLPSGNSWKISGFFKGRSNHSLSKEGSDCSLIHHPAPLGLLPQLVCVCVCVCVCVSIGVGGVGWASRCRSPLNDRYLAMEGLQQGRRGQRWVGHSGQAAGRWDQSWAPKDGETGQWGDRKGAPGPGNDLSKGSEEGSSPVCTEDGKGAGGQPG